jgi:ankyrin repeat protein
MGLLQLLGKRARGHCRRRAAGRAYNFALHDSTRSAEPARPAAVFAANPALADDPSALATAASNGHEAFVRLLLRHQLDLAARIDVDHYWSLGAKSRAIAELLFANGMDPSRRSWLEVTPLHHFAGTGDIDNAAVYLDHGADLHARDEDLRSTPLGWAAKFGRMEMAAFLLGRGAKPSLPGDPPWATPLAWATSRGHQGIVDLLSSASDAM